MNVFVVMEQDGDVHRPVAVTATYPGAEKYIDAVLSLPGAVGAFTVTQWRVLQDWEAGDV